MPGIKRNIRIGAIVRILSERPGHVVSYGHFSNLFSVAKSTISEDTVIIREIFRKFSLGQIETVVGASGGVKYIPDKTLKHSFNVINEICVKLSDTARILPGGFIYMSDILFDPHTVQDLGEMLAGRFKNSNPDFVLTVETKGIPIAMMTGRALNCPVVIARRDYKITEGPIVTINYVSASSHRIQTMSVSKRAIESGKRAVIVDDFMKGGGSAQGMVNLLSEFGVEVVGIGVVIATEIPKAKKVGDYWALIELEGVDDIEKSVSIKPAKWLRNYEQEVK